MFHIFRLLVSRTLFDSQNDPKMDPKMIPKSPIFATFLVPGPFPEAPGAFLDALRALLVPSGTLQKLLNDKKINFWTPLGALGALLGRSWTLLEPF